MSEKDAEGEEKGNWNPYGMTKKQMKKNAGLLLQNRRRQAIEDSKAFIKDTDTFFRGGDYIGSEVRSQTKPFKFDGIIVDVGPPTRARSNAVVDKLEPTTRTMSSRYTILYQVPLARKDHWEAWQKGKAATLVKDDDLKQYGLKLAHADGEEPGKYGFNAAHGLHKLLLWADDFDVYVLENQEKGIDFETKNILTDPYKWLSMVWALFGWFFSLFRQQKVDPKRGNRVRVNVDGVVHEGRIQAVNAPIYTVRYWKFPKRKTVKVTEEFLLPASAIAALGAYRVFRVYSLVWKVALFPYYALKWTIGLAGRAVSVVYRLRSRKERKELSAADIRALAGYFLAWAASVVALVVLAMHWDTTTAYVLCGVAGALSLCAYEWKARWTAMPAVALSAEIIMVVRDSSTLEQAIVTAAMLFVAVSIRCLKHDIRVPQVILWLVFRLVRIVQLTATPAAQWRMSQAALALIVIGHLIRRNVGIATDAPAYTIANAGLLLVVFVLYDKEHVLPWEIHIALLLVPLAYVVSTTILDDPEVPRKSSVVGLYAGLVAIAAIGGAFVYDRPVDPIARVDDPCNPALTNMHTCLGPQDNYVYDKCCMPHGYFIVPFAKVWRAVPEDICLGQLAAPGDPTDCCGAKRLPSTDAYMAGPYACMCNVNQEMPNGNKFENGACICSANYTGSACETKL